MRAILSALFFSQATSFSRAHPPFFLAIYPPLPWMLKLVAVIHQHVGQIYAFKWPVRIAKVQVTANFKDYQDYSFFYPFSLYGMKQRPYSLLFTMHKWICKTRILDGGQLVTQKSHKSTELLLFFSLSLFYPLQVPEMEYEF